MHGMKNKHDVEKKKDEVMHVPVGTPYSIAPECLTGSYTVQVSEGTYLHSGHLRLYVCSCLHSSKLARNDPTTF